MDTIHGFELLDERRVAEIEARARLYRHAGTGAQLISVANADENKVFGVTLRTPPQDSTGVAHILEHSVLCGSRKYPVKEPFVELLKGSLQTFLNAFTYPDRTCYPVASCNLADFYNLVDVYLDAVFHPLITENIFRQEGWHFELDAPGHALTRKGVVYNEMKGAYSSPDGVLSEFSQRVLFPDTTYGLDSGGDPEVIPELTFEAFRDFHRSHYHPSNARIWFYGDDADESRRLAKAAEYLDGFEALTPDSEVGSQARFSAPRRAARPFAGGAEAGAMFTENWLLPGPDDQETLLALEMLDHVLTGLPSSPLRLALMESGLGEDLAGVGLEPELRQMYYSVGLKGLDADRAQADTDRAREIMQGVFQRLADQGPEPGDLAAAVNSVEFDLRENNTGRFPRGLSLMLKSMTTWLYGHDPLAPLAFEGPLSRIKARLERGEPVFQDLVREHWLDNPHRVTLVLEPDPDLAGRNEERERSALDGIKAAMGPDEVQHVVRETAELKAMQAASDDPADLARIPRLEVADLERLEKPTPQQAMPALGPGVWFHDLSAQGIVYLDLGLDMAVLPGDLLPLAGLFGRALTELGTTRRGPAELSQWIARVTGGIDAGPLASAVLGSSDPVARLFVHAKAVAANLPETLDILGEILAEADFSDAARVRRLAMEEKARLEQRLVPMGHALVATRLGARSGPAGWVAEQTGGVSALMAVRAFVKALDEDAASALERLERMRSLLVSRPGLVLGVTAAGPDLAAAEKPLAAFLEALPERVAPRAAWRPALPALAEGLAVSAQVNYVGLGVDLSGEGWDFHGSALAVVRHLRMAWLWDRVRVQGGAYGAFCSLDRFTGAMSFVSYRDPNLDATLKTFEDTALFLRGLELDADELAKSVIGAMGEVDAYRLPDARGFTALLRRLTGDSLEVRQAMRDQLLATRPEDFHILGDTLAKALSGKAVAALGARTALEASGRGLEITGVL